MDYGEGFASTASARAVVISDKMPYQRMMDLIREVIPSGRTNATAPSTPTATAAGSTPTLTAHCAPRVGPIWSSI